MKFKQGNINIKEAVWMSSCIRMFFSSNCIFPFLFEKHCISHCIV